MESEQLYLQKIVDDKRRVERLLLTALFGPQHAHTMTMIQAVEQLEKIVADADGVSVVDQLRLARGNPGSVLTLAAPYTFPEVPGDQLLGGMPVRHYQPPVFTQRYIVGFIDRDAHDTIWYLRSHPETGAKEYSQRPEDATVMDERLSRDFVNKSPANRFSRAVV